MANTYYGTHDHNFMQGLELDEDIFGFGGNDTILGDAGHDRIVGGAGADHIYGGTGIDTADYATSSAGVTVLIGGWASGGDAQGDIVSTDIENLTGSAHDDNLISSEAANTLTGNAGDDRIWGLGGNDWLYGGTGDDSMSGGEGADYIDGGSGVDLVSYMDSAEGVTIQITGPSVGHAFVQSFGGTAAGDYLSATVESLEGSMYGDYLYGNDFANGLVGGAGNDVLFGRGGNDTITGGQGGDVLAGDAGIDTVSYTWSNAGVQIDLRGGYGWGGDAQGDYLHDTFENVEGSAFRDIVFGNDADNDLFLGDGNDGAAGNGGSDNIRGGNGNDFIMGDGGNDDLRGDAGDDKLFGGDGNDRLIGGDGNDWLEGGAGADEFRFTQQDLGDSDRITDFNHADGDRINLSSMDADTGVAGNQAFTYVGLLGFSGKAGELHAVVSKLGMVLSGDVDGDRIADFSIALDDAPVLTTADFLL
jgi:Ca2+-binding RTX toxin-like protein